MKVLLFAGEFKSREEACLYSEPQWEPEPYDSVPDDEYKKWEERNPVHRLKDNINTYLDSDFIETVDLDFSYLSNLNIKDEDINLIRKMILPNFNYMVLVFDDAPGGYKLNITPISNNFLKYCGRYELSWSGT